MAITKCPRLRPQRPATESTGQMLYFPGRLETFLPLSIEWEWPKEAGEKRLEYWAACQGMDVIRNDWKSLGRMSISSSLLVMFA